MQTIPIQVIFGVMAGLLLLVTSSKSRMRLCTITQSLCLGVSFALTNNLQFVAIDKLGPSGSNLTTLLAQLNIPFSAVLSYSLLHNTLSAQQIAGCIVVVVGAIVIFGPCE